MYSCNHRFQIHIFKSFHLTPIFWYADLCGFLIGKLRIFWIFECGNTDLTLPMLRVTKMTTLTLTRKIPRLPSSTMELVDCN